MSFGDINTYSLCVSKRCGAASGTRVFFCSPLFPGLAFAWRVGVFPLPGRLRCGWLSFLSLSVGCSRGFFFFFPCLFCVSFVCCCLGCACCRLFRGWLAACRWWSFCSLLCWAFLWGRSCLRSALRWLFSCRSCSCGCSPCRPCLWCACLPWCPFGLVCFPLVLRGGSCFFACSCGLASSVAVLALALAVFWRLGRWLSSWALGFLPPSVLVGCRCWSPCRAFLP